MFTVYVLRSRKTGRFYTGVTSHLETRLAQHNSDQSVSTKHRGPWELVHREDFPSLSAAVRRERSLKSGRGRAEVKRLVAQSSRTSGG